MWSSASSKELRMSLPITAVGPLKVETNPILIVSPADAEFASTSAVAPASQYAVLILNSPPSLSDPTGRLDSRAPEQARRKLSWIPLGRAFRLVREIARLQQAR